MSSENNLKHLNRFCNKKIGKSMIKDFLNNQDWFCLRFQYSKDKRVELFYQTLSREDRPIQNKKLKEVIKILKIIEFLLLR